MRNNDVSAREPIENACTKSGAMPAGSDDRRWSGLNSWRLGVHGGVISEARRATPDERSACADAACTTPL